MDRKTEILSCMYIKCRTMLDIGSNQILDELFGIYGPHAISMRKVFRWDKTVKAGKLSVEDNAHSDRPKTSVTKANIALVKVTVVAEQDVRLSVKRNSK